MNTVILLRVVVVTLVVALITSSCWAQGQEELWQALIAIAKQPWSAMTLMDLSSDLLVAAV